MNNFPFSLSLCLNGSLSPLSLLLSLNSYISLPFSLSLLQHFPVSSYYLYLLSFFLSLSLNLSSLFHSSYLYFLSLSIAVHFIRIQENRECERKSKRNKKEKEIGRNRWKREREVRLREQIVKERVRIPKSHRERV